MQKRKPSSSDRIQIAWRLYGTLCGGILALFSLALISCSIPTTMMAQVATSLAKTQVVPTQTVIASCVYSWASNFLPDVTAQIKAKLDAAGLTDVTISAVAFGEDCDDPVTYERRSFGAMQTDIDVTLSVTDLNDRVAIGNKLAKVFLVLVQFPPKKLPGAMPGTIKLYIKHGDQEKYLAVTSPEAIASYVKKKLKGAALLKALQAS
jgi:hypothetical protein